jgi:hypothetical protein
LNTNSESFNFSEYDDFYNDNFDSQLDEFFGGWDEDDTNSESSEGDSIEEDFVDDNQDFVPFVEHENEERWGCLLCMNNES